MMRRIVAVVAVAVLLASCGAASTSETTSTSITPAGKPAPDFTLTLSDGTDFTLSSETRPVYMVFWAEW